MTRQLPVGARGRAPAAFFRQELLHMVSTPLFSLIGAVVGDTIVYGAGRFANQWIEQRFGGCMI